MERNPGHLQEDSLLRQPFIEQMSLDEHMALHAPFFLRPDARVLVERGLNENGMAQQGVIYEDVLAVEIDSWRATLDPQTNIDETLYLQGYDYTQRIQMIEQMHAEFRDRAIAAGWVKESEEHKKFRKLFGH